MFNEAHRVLLFAHPSLNLRSTFAQGSVRVGGKNSEKKKLWQTLKVCQSVWRNRAFKTFRTPSVWCFALFYDWLLQESTAAFGG